VHCNHTNELSSTENQYANEGELERENYAVAVVFQSIFDFSLFLFLGGFMFINLFNGLSLRLGSSIIILVIKFIIPNVAG
jgi:hypothetical protein